ncbi:SCO2524 family protein [Plantactinospora sp. KLBMP9567]|uniref:SCO2524 family protein n=1 Tax=Plantactinospora sp. KLBMP9567 TaxID=3085900 RepID=UPI002980E9EC|nr:SCO2524 family protein [Plantactinospora sp. KLBMP9567]MDW5330041.1 SCO2524 family protein [Plantactinospora sp. KLBMP9567]
MRIQPRQELLEIWAATVRSSWQDGKWQWGGRDGPNSISDAEQLLCILLPATQADFGLDRPDETAEEMIRALRPLGTATQIPRVLIQVLTEYYQRYTDKSGTPVFSGRTYFQTDGGEPSEQQLDLDIVDSFAMSITLSLSAIGFARVFRTAVRREEILREIDELENMASARLTAAMVGLLRSFAVNVFDVDSDEGQALVRTLNQSNLPQRQIVAQLRRRLRQTIASFREVMIGSGQVADLDSPNRLFECGWSWGIVRDAPEVETTEPVGQQPSGVAPEEPYLYFTVIAIDAIEELFTERTRILGLLNEEQQRLSRALQLRWDLTRGYWATVATFGDGHRWPLEDIPWRTTDRDATDYYTLLVTSLAVKGLVVERGADADLSRVGAVLEELANRARITRRPFDQDPALTLHSPGVRLTLQNSDKLGGPTLRWAVTEFSALLLQRTAYIAGLLSDADQRARMLELADLVWDHLVLRRLERGAGRSLWDQPARVFQQFGEYHDEPSWYYTERVVQSLVTTVRVLRRPPLRSDRLTMHALDLLNEAEHLYDVELLAGAAEAGPKMQQTLQMVRVNLRRAREIVHERPGTAAALTSSVLRRLDELNAARRDVAEAG